MEKHLFLKGDSGIGKTTLLRELLKPYSDDVGGFLTRRLLDESGETAGFCLVPVQGDDLPESVGGYVPGAEHLFIEKTDGGWNKYPEVFETVGTKLLRELHGKRFCYLDEIGGIEMKSEAFRKALCQVLASDICCIGVIKNERNLNSMGTRVPMEQDSARNRNQLECEIMQQYGGVVIPYAESEKEAVKARIETWIQEIRRGSL